MGKKSKEAGKFRLRKISSLAPEEKPNTNQDVAGKE